MIALLATLPGRVIFPGSVLRARCRFVDEATDADQTPASVVFTLRTPAGTETSWTWTAPSTGPTLDARLVAFSSSVVGPAIIFEAQIAILAADAPGTWTFGWAALDGAGVAQVTQWGAVDVEPTADRPMQPAPNVAPANPYDELGADTWSWGYPWPSGY